VLSLFFSSEGAALHSDNDVVIVGAGVSGLYAAYALNDPGYDVLLVEATNRHGGRVQDALFGEVGIELGGEELYGPLNNFIFDDIASLSPPLVQTPIWTRSNSQDERIEIGGSAIWARLSGRNLREHSNERLQTHQS
jgi:monoamine oxidase